MWAVLPYFRIGVRLACFKFPKFLLEVPMKAELQSLWREDAGQGLVEYALIIALVAVGLIAILLVLRNSIGNVFNNAATQLNNAPANPYP
jgi:pilus assembly protein Flp/PilA